MTILSHIIMSKRELRCGTSCLGWVAVSGEGQGLKRSNSTANECTEEKRMQPDMMERSCAQRQETTHSHRVIFHEESITVWSFYQSICFADNLSLICFLPLLLEVALISLAFHPHFRVPCKLRWVVHVRLRHASRCTLNRWHGD